MAYFSHSACTAHGTPPLTFRTVIVRCECVEEVRKFRSVQHSFGAFTTKQLNTLDQGKHSDNQLSHRLFFEHRNQFHRI